MDIELEKMIVESFVIKRKKERILYELLNNKKRWYCIMGLEEYLDMKYMKIIDIPISSFEKIYEIASEYKHSDSCYVISANEDYDGQFMKLYDAIRGNVFYGPVLVSIIPGKVAYFEGESYKQPTRCMLIRD